MDERVFHTSFIHTQYATSCFPQLDSSVTLQAVVHMLLLLQQLINAPAILIAVAVVVVLLLCSVNGWCNAFVPPW